MTALNHGERERLRRIIDAEVRERGVRALKKGERVCESCGGTWREFDERCPACLARREREALREPSPALSPAKLERGGTDRVVDRLDALRTRQR